MSDPSDAANPLRAGLACRECKGRGDGGGFDRQGSHAAGEYREYDCPRCKAETPTLPGVGHVDPDRVVCITCWNSQTWVLQSTARNWQHNHEWRVLIDPAASR